MKPWEKYQQGVSGPWTKYQGGQADPHEQAIRDGSANSVKYGNEPGVGDLIQNAATFGWNDEIQGALRGGAHALVDAGRDIMGGELPDSMGETYDRVYDDTVGDIRARTKIAREKYGYAPEVVAGVLTGGPVAGAVKNVGSGIKEIAKWGGIYGGLAGAGESEGGLQEKAVGGLKGAGAGVVGGAVLGGVAKGAAKAAPYVRMQAKKLGINRTADEHLLKGLDASDMTPEQALQHYNRGQEARSFGSHEAELPEMIADFGEGTTRLARTTGTHTGVARQIARQKLDARQKGQYERVNDDLQRSLGVKSKDFYKTADDLATAQSTNSTKAYNAARENAQPFEIGDVVTTWRNEAANFPRKTGERNTIDKALSYLEHAAPGGTVDDLQRFDYAKQAIDGLIDETIGPRGNKNLRRILLNIKKQAVDLADQSNPLYREAREMFAGYADIRDALVNGRDFAKGDYEVTRQMFGRMTQSEQKAFRLGMAREVKKSLGRKQRTHNQTVEFNKPYMEEQLDTLVPRSKRAPEGKTKDWRANQLNDLIDREGKFVSTRNTVLGGSPTPEKLADDAEFMTGTIGGAIKSKGGLTPAVIDYTATKLSHMFELRAAEAEKVAKILFETDPKIIRATLERLSRTMRPSKFTRLRDYVQRLRSSYQRANILNTGVGRTLGSNQAIEE